MRIEFGLKPLACMAPSRLALSSASSSTDGFTPSARMPDSDKEQMAMIKAGLPLRPSQPGRKELLASLAANGLSAAAKQVEAAYDFAKIHHAGQKRDDGSDYYHHSVRTTLRLVDDFGITNVDAIKAALLHDVMEDTDVSKEQIRARFGEQTAALVGHMSKPDLQPGESYGQRNQRYLNNLEAVGSRELIAIKLSDRLDNIEDTHLMPDRVKIDRYLKDTRDHYMPLAARHFPGVDGKLEARMGQIDVWRNATS